MDTHIHMGPGGIYWFGAHPFLRSTFHKLSLGLVRYYHGWREFVLGLWGLGLYVKGSLNLANLYILLHHFMMEAVRNVGILFCIGTTDQPKTSSHAAIVLGWRKHFFQVDEPVYISE
jgi:hypothetical protein